MPKQKRHSKPPSGKNLRFGPSGLNLAWMRKVAFLFCYARTMWYDLFCHSRTSTHSMSCHDRT
jgi:hypothetical protein